MKIKVNIREYLEAATDHNGDLHLTARFEPDELFETNAIPEEQEIDVDIDELLAENRRIAHIWGTDDIRQLRPDLDDDQAWAVLQEVMRRVHASCGIFGDVVETIAGQLYPEPERHRQAQCAVLDVGKLAAGDIAFMSNSWRGDRYEPRLREAIAGSPPPEPPETDIHEILAGRRLIGLLWGVEDVREVRPDLSEDQCWEVLQDVERRKDADLGIDWQTLELAADELFGAPEDEAEEE